MWLCRKSCQPYTIVPTYSFRTENSRKAESVPIPTWRIECLHLVFPNLFQGSVVLFVSMLQQQKSSPNFEVVAFDMDFFCAREILKAIHVL